MDDGGHTFEQQIITVHNCIPNINDEGLIVVEDTHTSYFKSFGYPSKYSFIEWTKKLIDNINSRFPSVKVSVLQYNKYIYSITAFESIISFKINRKKCFENESTSNDGITSNAADFRYEGSKIANINIFEQRISKILNWLKYISIIKLIKNKLFESVKILLTKKELIKLKRFF